VVKIMGDKEQSAFEDMWEEGFDGLESANRLHIFYLFENVIKCTDVFLETIKLIDENDAQWKEYTSLLDENEDIPEIIMRMATSLVTLHVARLKLSYTEEDVWKSIVTLYAYLSNHWDELLMRYIRARHEWLNLVDDFQLDV